MKNIIGYIRNERGNVTILSISFFFVIMLILFMALFNLSTVFAFKEQASNVAQQAALAAIKPVYDEMETAMERYDASPMRVYDERYILPAVKLAESSIRASHWDWAQSEVRYAAIDQVLGNWLPANPELLGFVTAGLTAAQAEIPGVVTKILNENHATVSGSIVVIFNAEQRVEVQTSARFRSTTFDFPFMPDPQHEEEVYQTAQSRQIGFLDAVGGWGSISLTL